MRLLTYTHNGRLSVTRDFADNIPPYAILSHTWGADEEEVTYQELQHVSTQTKAGYKKIRFCGERARRDGITHFWVDTCCIDKTNHSELTEAITLMYRWYQHAQKCYVYLSDVSTQPRPAETDDVWEISFRASRWFTRGWTLQELLAPRVVEFFSRQGDLLGTKHTLASQIHEITTIPLAALHGAPLAQFSVAERIRWSQKRNTEKKEDQAYCLLGVFEVFLPLIYGEGENALRRLEREINERYGADITSGLRTSETTRSLGLCLQSAPVIQPSSFVGRAREIDVIYSILQPDKLSAEQQRVVLGGMGGIGKTQLAIAYARLYQQSYTSVLWLNATSKSTLYTSVRAIVQTFINAEEFKKLDDQQMLCRMHAWLSLSENIRWLLIFDNHDEPEQFDLNTFCPSIGHGSVIITTRLPELVTGPVVRVQPLEDVKQSLAILQSRSGRHEIQHDEGARRLAHRLDGLPLALVTAGAYLRRSPITFQQYLDVYEQRWQIDPRRSPRLRDYRDQTLYTTWNLSYSRLKSEDPEAANMLTLLAYFDHQDIWYELFHAGLSDRLPEWLQSCLDDPIDFENVMGILVDYCLVEVRYASRSYSIHSCVHDWTLGALNREISAQLYWYAFDCVRANIDTDDYEVLGQIKYNRVSGHGVRLTYHRFIACDESEDYLSERLDDAVRIATMLQSQVQLSAAEQIYLRALVGYEKMLGSDHVSTLTTVNYLGVLYRAQGKLDKAEQMYARALAGREKALGPDHVSTLMTVNNLGVLFYDQSKLGEAEQMFERALVGREKALGPDHVSTLMTVNNLGVLYRDQDKLGEAEQMHARALAGREKALGPDHVSTLMTVNNLGNLYRDQGKLGEAEQMFERALAGREKALGPNHTSTLGTVSNLGLLYNNQGKLNEAEQMYARALAGKEKALGPDHISTLTTVNYLGVLYRAQGKLDEAEQMYARALAGREKALGLRHTSTLRTAQNLSEFYRDQGKGKEAELIEMRYNP